MSTQIKYTKAAILQSEKYREVVQHDMLAAFLDDNKLYTEKDIERIILIIKGGNE